MMTVIRFLSPTGWKIVGVVGALLVLITAVILFGNSRYDAGVKDTDAKWEAASAKLQQRAATSADAATRREAPRIAAQNAQVAAEREKIDEAIAEGRSPLDALFPAAGGVRDR